MISEEDLVKRLENLEFQKQDAKRKLLAAKKELIDAETHFIGVKLDYDRTKEELRRFRNANPKYESNHRDREIERFRILYPGLVEEAAQRDKDRK